MACVEEGRVEFRQDWSRVDVRSTVARPDYNPLTRPGLGPRIRRGRVEAIRPMERCDCQLRKDAASCAGRELWSGLSGLTGKSGESESARIE